MNEERQLLLRRQKSRSARSWSCSTRGNATSLIDANNISTARGLARQRPALLPGASAHETCLFEQVARLEAVVTDADGHIALLKGLLGAARRDLPAISAVGLEIDRALAASPRL